ncbi:MAG: FAD:protein FMN transferase [Gammaproteobacteria bacterium]|nr:FAD:protein FMN transferase [Gammaproteobacteria bacterium]
MASPCEVFVDDTNESITQKLCESAFAEAQRIEKKYSRYRSDNIIHRINTSAGKAVEVDEETAQLLDFAQQCYELSDGLFDITSGILRQAWKFDGSANLPEQSTVQALLPLIGWHRVDWRAPRIILPEGMEIDLGGIGKEYAVDKTILLLGAENPASVLVNFGGDLHVSGPRSGNRPWLVGIENPDVFGEASSQVEIRRGALTTSGDSQRYLLRDGVRYSHVLNPQTGWPVENSPRSVTVAANTCIEAGMISTLAMLAGGDAEEFLQAQNVRFWCQR